MKKFFSALETNIASGAIILIALLSAGESLARLLLHTGIPFSQDIITRLLLVAACTAGMITTRKGEHLSIGLVYYIENKKVLCVLSLLTNALSCFVSVILTFASIVYIKIAVMPESQIAFIPEWLFSLALPAGFAIMALRFSFFIVKGLSGENKEICFVRRAALRRAISFTPLILGIVCSIPLMIKWKWGFDAPDAINAAGALFVTAANTVKIPALIVIVLLALSGMPLFIVMASLALLLFESSGWEIDTIIVNVNTALTTTDFIAIPLFTLVGFFLSESKAGERLVTAFKAVFGWFPGGLIVVTIILCAFFTTFTGASGVTILALGGILFAILSENAPYPARFSRGLLTSSGSIGLLFPPSLPLIIVALTMQQSILKFFAAGALPGLLLTGTMIVFGIAMSIKTKIPLQKFNLHSALSALKQAIFELLLPVILVAGFFSGILSLVEIGSAALVYVFVIEVCVKRDIKLRDVGKVFAKALPITGGILAVIALSKALSDYIVFTQAPENFARFLQSAVQSKLVFLLLLNLVLLIAGCLMDIFSATVVVLPLIAPLAAVYNIDPIHLGIIFLVNLEAGYLTPPVGLNLFLASYRFQKPFVEICRDMLPFLLIQLIVVLLVTYIPPLSTWLPQFF